MVKLPIRLHDVTRFIIKPLQDIIFYGGLGEGGIG